MTHADLSSLEVGRGAGENGGGREVGWEAGSLPYSGGSVRVRVGRDSHKLPTISMCSEEQGKHPPMKQLTTGINQSIRGYKNVSNKT